jgi:hypothetical protein
MAAYGSNSIAVRFQETTLPKALPENKSQEMPAHSPRVASAMPGGKPAGKPGKGMRSLRSPKWISHKKKKHA